MIKNTDTVAHWMAIAASERMLRFEAKEREQIAIESCAEVLASACRDAIGGNQSFADFCSDYGYDEDSRKAEAVYFACQDCGKLALRVLKTRALVQQFADLSNRL